MLKYSCYDGIIIVFSYTYLYIFVFSYTYLYIFVCTFVDLGLGGFDHIRAGGFDSLAVGISLKLTSWYLDSIAFRFIHEWDLGPF